MNRILPAEACYAALSAHDARFDGRFFVGVSSTGIYCRPVCRVKRPRAENCSYYISAAAAEAAGYRPCLKCRPELAPGLAPVDMAGRLARKAAAMIEEDCLSDSSLAQLADSLGVTDRHVRRVFSAEYGVSPVQYLQTRRLLLAKQLLTDTALSITDIAFNSGFGSLRRFNDLFKKRYKLNPRELRKTANTATNKNSNTFSLLLGYRPPYEWDTLLSFLSKRGIPGVEHVSDNAYHRAVIIKKGKTVYRGWISVSHVEKKTALSVTISCSLLPVLPKVVSRVRLLFDVNSDPLGIYEKIKTMNKISPGLSVPGIRLPGCFDPFEMGVRAVLGQQITVKAASTLASRLVLALGTKIDTPFEFLTHTFPAAEDITRLSLPIENQLGPLGITSARSRSIFALAEAMVNRSITLSQSSEIESEMQKLQALPGFGTWTVNYIAMRALAWPDAFPHTDYGIKKALPGMTETELLKLADTWRPWRAYGAINLWNSLEHKKGETE